MTKEEISEKRGRAIKSLNDVGAILSLDEMYIDELEKENAELKEHHKSVCETLTNTHRSLREQLTKAKEILEELAKMEYVINPPVDKVRSLMVKAEQFLKEIEK